jgi:hypothetical protein
MVCAGGRREERGEALLRTRLRRRAAVTFNLWGRPHSASRVDGHFALRSEQVWRQGRCSWYAHEPEPESTMRFYLSISILCLAACNRSDRKQQVAECVGIYRTAYVTGGVRECLMKRYGWSEEDASEAQGKLDSHPDSAARGDSGQVGDSLRK